MKFILHYSPSSPFCRIVLMAAAHKRVDLELYISNPFRVDNYRLLSANPAMQLPTLEIISDDSSGRSKVDSIEICRYLDNLSDEHKIFYENDEFQNVTLVLRAILEKALAIVYEKRRPAEKQSEENISRCIGIINNFLINFEKIVGLYLSENINIVTITLASLLGYLDFRLSAAINWRENSQKLAEWFFEFQKNAIFYNTQHFEISDLEQGAVYSYAIEREQKEFYPLSHFGFFEKRSSVIEHSASGDKPEFNL